MHESCVFACVKCFVLLQLMTNVVGWDSEDLELFDLVEEVNQNFYDVLDVSQSTEAADLRRAYRKLSLQLHPDKNKEPDAEIKFRQIVAVYEVLKDAARRAKYDEILANGLPDWRQPVYYYRRVRKMGLLELAILLAVILTTGHIITLWSIYLERRFEKQEVFRSKKKRDKKGRHGGDAGLDDDRLEAELSLIRRPQISDTLPCVVFRFAVRVAVGIPSSVRLVIEWYHDWQTAEDQAEDEQPGFVRVRTARKKPSQEIPCIESLPTEYSYSQDPSVLHENSTSELPLEKPLQQTAEGSEWTEQELALLAKAVARYPGGVADRWEKISHMVGRSVKEVTAMSRQVKTHVARSVDPSAQGITASALPSSTDHHILDCPTQRQQDGEFQDLQPPDHRLLQMSETANRDASRDEQILTSSQEMETSSAVVKRRTKPTPKSIDQTLMISQVPPTSSKPATTAAPGTWTQLQQKQLESALSQVPKGVSDRWDRIAELVSDKTKDECIQRFKHLAEVVRKKQQEKNTTNQQQ